MKRLLVNMNRSGYFWHELSPVPQPDSNTGELTAKMKREISEDSYPSITAMRTYEQYNYVFMKGNGDYILAIRNLNDPRTDGSGRSLKQHVIFEDEDKDLLLKLLAFYLSDPKDFEQWITGECFKPGQNDALCKLVPFSEKLEKIKKSTLNPSLKKYEFAISSSQSAEWLQEKLEIKGVNVAEYLNKLDSLIGTNLISEPPVGPDPGNPDTIVTFKEEIRSKYEVLSVRLKKLEDKVSQYASQTGSDSQGDSSSNEASIATLREAIKSINKEISARLKELEDKVSQYAPQTGTSSGDSPDHPFASVIEEIRSKYKEIADNLKELDDKLQKNEKKTERLSYSLQKAKKIIQYVLIGYAVILLLLFIRTCSANQKDISTNVQVESVSDTLANKN